MPCLSFRALHRKEEQLTAFAHAAWDSEIDPDSVVRIRFAKLATPCPAWIFEYFSNVQHVFLTCKEADAFEIPEAMLALPLRSLSLTSPSLTLQKIPLSITQLKYLQRYSRCIPNLRFPSLALTLVDAAFNYIVKMVMVPMRYREAFSCPVRAAVAWKCGSNNSHPTEMELGRDGVTWNQHASVYVGRTFSTNVTRISIGRVIARVIQMPDTKKASLTILMMMIPPRHQRDPVDIAVDQNKRHAHLVLAKVSGSAAPLVRKAVRCTGFLRCSRGFEATLLTTLFCGFWIGPRCKGAGIVACKRC